MNRRQFLHSLSLPAACAATLAPRPGLLRELAATPGSPAELAQDEDFWARVQMSFSCDRSVINLNNGGVSPAPIPVQESLARHLAYANGLPARRMFQEQTRRKESVREGLARAFGADPEEVAITRNTSEGLQTLQFGIDLRPGDEVLTTDQDYPRMRNTFQQRVRREGIAYKEIVLPVPAHDDDEIVRRFEEAITERTRVILLCHMVNLTGQVLPVRRVVELGRERGIPVLVDGAHAFAHVPFDHADLDCDFYATSLHKWLFAPFGTGMLYVRRERIGEVWPLMAAAETQAEDIRKFEEIGTHPVANFLAIADALAFHEGLGAERKAARLVYLRDRWARRLAENDRVVFQTSLDEGRAYGIANFRIEGVAVSDLASYLMRERGIIVTGIGHEHCAGLRISPSVYTTVEEVDRFAETIEDVLENGLPA